MKRKFRNQIATAEQMQNNIIDTTGRPVTAIGVGSRVKLTGDNYSPTMSVIGLPAGGGVLCGWFVPVGTAGLEASTFSVIQVEPVCLTLVQGSPEEVVH